MPTSRLKRGVHTASGASYALPIFAGLQAVDAQVGPADAHVLNSWDSELLQRSENSHETSLVEDCLERPLLSILYLA